MRFLREPANVEAIQYDGENEEEIKEAYGNSRFTLLGDSAGFMIAFVNTHGEEAFARPGDWIVRDPEHDTLEAVSNIVMMRDYVLIEEEVTSG